MRPLWRGRIAFVIAPISTTAPALFLGLDAGGTQTRWAVADADGALLHEGQVAGVSGLMLMDDGGRAQLGATLQALAAEAGSVRGVVAGAVVGVVAGVTGVDSAQAPLLRDALAAALSLDSSAVQAMSDIELACHAAFAPGDGYVVYAGTGSIAAFVDEHGQLQRAGGRGAVIDDAGGGHWIARQALRQVWRAEDETPGAWQRSPLAQQLFKVVGGHEWAHTRQWVYSASRGELGTLALAVAAAADEDPMALIILQAAGAELARLARALLLRHGPRPLALAGRVFDLHPAITRQLLQTLPEGTPVQRSGLAAHVAAAQMACAKAARKNSA